MRAKVDTNSLPSIQEARNDDRVLAGIKKFNPCSLEQNHLPSLILLINKERGDRNDSQLKTLHPICIDSIDAINQPASSAVISILHDVNKIERAVLKE